MKKVVLVTGASRGIGRSIALKFAKEGYQLAICSKSNKEALLQTEHDIKELGCDVLTFLGDMSNDSMAHDLFEQIKNRFGHLDVLVNNAGISMISLFTDLSYAEREAIMHNNLSSVMNCCHYAIPLFLSRHHGKIINISSVWGTVGASCEAVYSASKGAINAFTKALGKELAPSNIQVNAIACGAIDTDMNRCFSEEELTSLIEEIPAGRMGQPEEVAELTFDLTRHDYLTAQVITLDGGWL